MLPLRQNRPGRSSTREDVPNRATPPTRLENIRTNIHGLFSGRSTVGGSSRGALQTPESPKSPPPAPTLQPVSGLGSRLIIPYLQRSHSQLESQSQSRAESRTGSHSSSPPPPPGYQSTNTSSDPFSVPYSTPTSWVQAPEPTYSSRSQRARERAQRVRGVDSADQSLAALAQDARRRTRHRSRRSERDQGRSGSKIKNRRIRNKILSCFISGIFLTLVLTVYLALALSNREERQEFHVLLIMIILLTTIFFCHSLIRLCMMLVNPPDDNASSRRPEMIGPGGYANPVTPVQVTLARDEEAAGIESEATKYPPPAYGLWRESVRVDPNRIFWQRNQNHSATTRTETRPTTANRPPSYISEEGVDYVIEAQPRSIAPPVDVPLPLHPSERARW